MNVFVSANIPEAGIKLLKEAGHQVTVSSAGRPLNQIELIEQAASAQGIISMPIDKIDVHFLDARPNIRAVSNIAVGYNNIDVAACTARKVGASNTPGVLNNATAELAFTLILSAARCAGQGERYVRAGKWIGWGNNLLGVDVAEGTLGIVGAGRIGARLARMASGFDMKLLYHNRKPSAEMESLGAKLVSLPDLMAQSDFVSVHVPMTPETRHLIGAKEFAHMKSTAVFVNTSRGPVVDEAALAAALQSRRIFAAGLDVYENEPTIHPDLYKLENVVLLPHIGSATTHTRDQMSELAARNLIAMLAGKKPPAPLNPELWPE